MSKEVQDKLRKLINSLQNNLVGPEEKGFNYTVALMYEEIERLETFLYDEEENDAQAHSRT